MTACHRKPDNKKKFIGSIGKALVHRHGKKPFYKPSEIRQAADTCGYAVDLHCWAYCVFCLLLTLRHFMLPQVSFATTLP